MKRIINVGLILALLSVVILLNSCKSQVNLDDEINVETKDQYCNEDSECIMAMVKCSCDCGVPINKIYLQKYLNMKEEKCKSYEGIMCKMDCRTDLKCVNNSCVKDKLQIPPDKNKTCEDFGGKDYYSKGQVKACDFTTFEEPGATSPIGCALHEDFCPTGFDDPTGKELYEYYCEGSEFKSEKYTCPNGCQNGACIK